MLNSNVDALQFCFPHVWMLSLSGAQCFYMGRMYKHLCKISLRAKLPDTVESHLGNFVLNSISPDHRNCC